MTAKTGKQMMSMHILPQILKSKSTWNLAIQQNVTWRIFFFKNYDKNEAGGTSYRNLFV